VFNFEVAINVVRKGWCESWPFKILILKLTNSYTHKNYW